MGEPYNVIIDDGATLIRADGQPTYISRAAPGYDTDEEKWQIRKCFYDANNKFLYAVFADGNPGFVHIQDDYSTYTYTPTGS